MNIDTAYFHQVCINVLYGALVLLTFVILERFIYYTLLNFRAGRLARASHSQAGLRPNSPVLKEGRDVVTRGVAEYVAEMSKPHVPRSRLEDLSSALFIGVNGRVSARLWILDTIVTAAPLLGLLGTILGIMETFNALSSGGISDPAAVSRGIAAALLATAIGIGTALYGLIGHNLLHRFADYLTEEFKGVLLAAQGDIAEEAPKPAAE